MDPNDVKRVRDVIVEADGVPLRGIMGVPSGASGLVLFAHGSGSSRRSPRNAMVAQVLQDSGLATLLFDLLTKSEETDQRAVFDIPLLAQRLWGAGGWARRQEELSNLPLGYFGASTGAAAALVASVNDQQIAAIVSRGGRTDLAGDALEMVKAPTLLIVGDDDDEQVTKMNYEAYERLQCEKHLEIIPGATHLFEEPGALEQVAELARDWFTQHLGGKAS